MIDVEYPERQKEWAVFSKRGHGNPAFMLPAAFLLLILMSGTMGFWLFPANEDEGTLHIHLISASEEYESENSLKETKKALEEHDEGVKITASWGEDAGSDLPNIELLGEADLLIVFARRMTLPEDQLNYITQHIEAEKPVIGIRTSSHAFQGFLELDARVFGGDYDGHGDDESVDVSFAEDAEEHPIMNGVDAWNRPGKIYHNPDLGPQTQALLLGRGLDSDIYEPLAWTNMYGENGRAFYTSMGLPADFKNDNFLRMLNNAISWTTGYELSSFADGDGP